MRFRPSRVTLIAGLLAAAVAGGCGQSPSTPSTVPKLLVVGTGQRGP